jgi:hypothetical protein
LLDQFIPPIATLSRNLNDAPCSKPDVTNARLACTEETGPV